MTYADLETDREREIWQAEMKAMAASPKGGEYWASKAIERHRDCYSGPVEAAKTRRRKKAESRGIPADAELGAMAARCLQYAADAVGPLPPPSSRRARMVHRGLIRACAMSAMRMLVGTGLAAKAFGITEQGMRNRSVYLRTDYPEMEAKVRVFVASVQEERRHQESNDAGPGQVRASDVLCDEGGR
jgi:hypothetical protein